MKPIPPAVVTAVAVSAAVAQNSAIRAGDSASPRACDSTSPRASTFKLRAPAMARPPTASEHAQRGRREGRERQVAHQPEQHAAQPGLIAQGQHQADDRGAAGGHHDAVEQQSLRRPAAAGMGQREHQEGRTQGSRAGRPIDDEAAETQQHGPSAATAAPPEMPSTIGIGQRIAQQHLHQHAGERQQAAGAEGIEGAGQAQLQNDLAHHRIMAARARPPVQRVQAVSGVLPIEMASTRLKSAANANNGSNRLGFMCRVPYGPCAATTSGR